MTTFDQNPSPTKPAFSFRKGVGQGATAARFVIAKVRKMLTPTPVPAQEQLAKTARREAARRAVDALLR